MRFGSRLSGAPEQPESSAVLALLVGFRTGRSRASRPPTNSLGVSRCLNAKTDACPFAHSRSIRVIALPSASDDYLEPAGILGCALVGEAFEQCLKLLDRGSNVCIERIQQVV
jgi:hypothetical protein